LLEHTDSYLGMGFHHIEADLSVQRWRITAWALRIVVFGSVSDAVIRFIYRETGGAIQRVIADGYPLAQIGLFSCWGLCWTL